MKKIWRKNGEKFLGVEKPFFLTPKMGGRKKKKKKKKRKRSHPHSKMGVGGRKETTWVEDDKGLKEGEEETKRG